MDWFSLIAEIGVRDRADSLADDSDALQSTSVGKFGTEAHRDWFG